MNLCLRIPPGPRATGTGNGDPRSLCMLVTEGPAPDATGPSRPFGCPFPNKDRDTGVGPSVFSLVRAAVRLDPDSATRGHSPAVPNPRVHLRALDACVDGSHTHAVASSAEPGRPGGRGRGGATGATTSACRSASNSARYPTRRSPRRNRQSSRHPSVATSWLYPEAGSCLRSSTLSASRGVACQFNQALQ